MFLSQKHRIAFFIVISGFVLWVSDRGISPCAL